MTDVAGNLFNGALLDFFFMQADANRDRRVNLADFNILAARFGSVLASATDDDADESALA